MTSIRFAILSAFVAMAVACEMDSDLVVLGCRETKPWFGGESHTWILRLHPRAKTAEMVVHVPADSVAAGVPAGSRRGILLTSERQYDVEIPVDEGGSGKDSWFRPSFNFEIDRFSGAGAVRIAGKDAPVRGVQCAPVSDKPKI